MSRYSFRMARLVLTHLPDPEGILERLARRLERLQRLTSMDRIEWGVRHLVYERAG